ncbi:GLO1 [Symbiodinium sp. CCMP2592]|nr:GLO1 [Symbiodinium sp. CCMP2592]
MTGWAEARNPDGMKKCLAYQITQAAPSIEFLPEDLRGPLQMLSRNPLALMPGPLQTMATVGETLNDCTDKKSHNQLLECFGFRILEHTSRLKFLLRLKEVMARYVEVFVQIGNKMMERAMEENPTLLQTAVHSKFGALGDRPIVHHSSSTLEIKTYVQRPEFLQQKAQSRHERGDDRWTEFGWQIGGYGPQTASLITQFNGREKSTGSCLAFAPRTRTGTDQQATEADWQVENEDDFLQLEPYAVPCSNAWMQQNWNKWQGYSFYTWPTQVEKCITVNFNIAIQPVVALIGGIQFKVLPDPLAQLSTMVCWPNGQPGGVDLSVLRSQISCGNVMVFSRTLRLAKRFGDFTDFVNENINGGFQTWRSAFGVGYASGAAENLNVDPRYKAVRSQFGPPEGESSTGIDSMARSAFLQAIRARESEAHTDDLYLVEGNDLYLQTSLGFGPYQSGVRRIPLANIAHQLQLAG